MVVGGRDANEQRSILYEGKLKAVRLGILCVTERMAIAEAERGCG
jgi:hypothetical protein